MNVYDPDPKLERQVIRGLLLSPEFARTFCERRLGPSIFESDDQVQLRIIAMAAATHFQRFSKCVTPAIILNNYSRELNEREDADAELKTLALRRVIRSVIDTSLNVGDLPYLLESLLEQHRSYRTLADMKDLAQVYKCRFDHGQTEDCKTCSYWQFCKSLKFTKNSFSEKVWSLQNYQRSKLQQETGSTKTEKGVASEAFDSGVSEYQKRKEIRMSGGEDFTFGIKTPWPTVTNVTDGWKPGRLYGIFAPKKTGKTTILIGCAASAIQHGHNVALFAMEDTKQEWMDKFICRQAAISSEDFTDGRLTGSEERRLFETTACYKQAWADGTIGEIFQYHRPIEQISLGDIRQQMDEIYASGKKVGLIIVDHLHILALPYGEGINREDQLLSKLAVEHKAFAQNYECAVLMAGQLKTSGERKGEARGSDKLFDCFDAAFEVIASKGSIMMNTKVARHFAPFSIELEDRRSMVNLPELETNTATLLDEKIELDDSDLI